MDDETERQSAWEDIGAVASRALAPTTASSTPSTKPRIISAPTTDAECRKLREWAERTPIAPQAVASPAQITRHISFMAATLPSKGVDDVAGKMRVAVYQSLLAGHSDQALAYMARRACQTMDWFPTPRQCLDLLAEYRAPEPPQSKALRLCHTYAHGAFERWLENVRAGQRIGDVPEGWLRIAAEQGPVRRLIDGSYVSRALYHGPFKAYAPASAIEAAPADETGTGSAEGESAVPQADAQRLAA